MNSVMVNVTGFIGDILFASSAAKHLIKKYDEVHYHIQQWGPYELLRLNPYITSVSCTPTIQYARPSTFICNQIDQREPATTQFQRACGIDSPTLGYEVYTNPHLDEVAIGHMEFARQSGRKIIAYQSNWKERSFGFTKDEYARGINVPPLGYGGRRRNTNRIVEELSRKYNMLEVGMPDGTPNNNYQAYSTAIYSQTASIIKACDYMIGGEGGLTNLAAGVGTKTIITGDFIHQLYGWNGVIKKIKDPQMGPRVYFPDAGHTTLDPFLTDDEVVERMMEIIK